MSSSKQIDQVTTSAELSEAEKEAKRVGIVKDQARALIIDAISMIHRARAKLAQIENEQHAECIQIRSALDTLLRKI
jgi:hypothetical protein